MYSIDPHAALTYYRSIAEHTDREIDRRLDRFSRSLNDWLQAALNWPLEDWEADFETFVQHSRKDGWVIAPESQAQLRQLIADRVRQVGVFAPKPEREAKPEIQLAAVMFASDEGTDATFDRSAKAEPDSEPELETAGPGPEVSDSYKAKVQLVLQILDPEVESWWTAKNIQGLVRSRDAWGPRYNVLAKIENDRPIITVDQSFTVGQTAQAIIVQARTKLLAGDFGPHFKKHRLYETDDPTVLSEWFQEAATEAASYAAMAAELYYGSLASLTPSGDLIVSFDEIRRRGFGFSHVILALPVIGALKPGKHFRPAESSNWSNVR